LWANGYQTYAVACLENAEHFDPTDPRWPYFQGERMLADNVNAGVARMRDALRLARKPEHEEGILLRLALILIEDGQLDDGEQYLQTLAERDDRNPGLPLGRALLALARGNRPAAREQLSKLTDSPFSRKRACTLLVQLCDGDPVLARIYQDKVGKLPPD